MEIELQLEKILYLISIKINMIESFIGILAGVLTRTIVPYLVVLKSNPRLKWKNKYLISTIAGLILAVIVSLLIYFQLNKELSFGVAFVTAYTLQSLSRETQKLFGY